MPLVNIRKVVQTIVERSWNLVVWRTRKRSTQHFYTDQWTISRSQSSNRVLILERERSFLVGYESSQAFLGVDTHLSNYELEECTSQWSLPSGVPLTLYWSTQRYSCSNSFYHAFLFLFSYSFVSFLFPLLWVDLRHWWLFFCLLFSRKIMTELNGYHSTSNSRDQDDADDHHLFEMNLFHSILKEYALKDPKLHGNIYDEKYLLRSLAVSDYQHGYVDLLRKLTECGTISPAGFEERFKALKQCPNTYYILVLQDTQTDHQIVGSATLVCEKKFIRQLATRGRIEDVIVHDRCRGQQLGKLLIASVDAVRSRQMWLL